MSTYVSLSDKLYDELSAKMRDTYPNVCIVWIEKLSNSELEEKYESYKRTLAVPNEKRLFHGTSEAIARVIAREGFDASKNKVSAHGVGTYFSTRAIYSSSYCKRAVGNDIAYMLVCDVALGRVGLGRSGVEIPKQFDSVCDNLKQPDMYVVNKREAGIGRFLIAFYPEAK